MPKIFKENLFLKNHTGDGQTVCPSTWWTAIDAFQHPHEHAASTCESYNCHLLRCWKTLTASQHNFEKFRDKKTPYMNFYTIGQN